MCSIPPKIQPPVGRLNFGGHWNDLARPPNGWSGDKSLPSRDFTARESGAKQGGLTSHRMEEKNKAKKGARRGRKPKDAGQKASYTVGSFKFTKADKARYDALYKASGMSNQTEFLRQIVFTEKLQLHYSDTNTKLIYEKLVEIQRELHRIGINYNQVVARVHAVGGDRNIYVSLQELVALQGQIEQTLRQLPAVVKAIHELGRREVETGREITPTGECE
jgi:hypothetical protein